MRKVHFCTVALLLAPCHHAVAQHNAQTLSYVVLNHGRPAGSMEISPASDSTVVRFQYVDRNRGPRSVAIYRFDSKGNIARRRSGGMGTDFFQTQVGEEFTVAGSSVEWRSSADSGRAARNDRAFYRAVDGTPYDDASLAAFLLRQPRHSGALLPRGSARAEVLADTAVTLKGETHRIRLVSVEGVYTSPILLWLDSDDALFATGSSWFTTVRRGWEAVLPSLRSIETAEIVRESAALARKLAPSARGTIAIRNGDVFDSESGTLRPHTTIIVNGDRIVAVGPAASMTIPAGATIIDATGRTVLPGLWDMHTHLFHSDETAGVLQLAAGITTTRDMASDVADALSQRRRAESGEMLAPRKILAGFMDGPGLWAGPTTVLIRTEDEAREWIARYDSLGYKQIKVYNLIHPDLIPAIAAETHKRGMRLSGHVPRGLSVPDAVTLGFDEIQHAAFLFSTFFPDSLFVPKMRSYGQVAAAVLPRFDVDGPEMTRLIAFLREHGTVIDGTFNAWVQRSIHLENGNDIVFGPSLDWLPQPMRREYVAGAPGSPADADRARVTNTRYLRLLKRLFDGGVTLVPGTDNLEGLSYHGELEIYERAGIPAASVLQIATIVPARVMKEDKDYGSIAPGKVADLVIVKGRPTERITDLRKTERVMRAGRLYDSTELYLAVGVTRKP